jgi:WhiB family redox-sensing transcriptional regulator
MSTGTGPFVELPLRGYARWWDDAACATEDPELFFPQDRGTTEEKRAAEKAAKRVCRRCAVRGKCLDIALGAEEQFGVWGGLSARERTSLLAEDDTIDLAS